MPIVITNTNCVKGSHLASQKQKLGKKIDWWGSEKKMRDVCLGGRKREKNQLNY
jgi:hypothetical protein